MNVFMLLLNLSIFFILAGYIYEWQWMKTINLQKHTEGYILSIITINIAFHMAMIIYSIAQI